MKRYAVIRQNLETDEILVNLYATKDEAEAEMSRFKASTDAEFCDAGVYELNSDLIDPSFGWSIKERS